MKKIDFFKKGTLVLAGCLALFSGKALAQAGVWTGTTTPATTTGKAGIGTTTPQDSKLTIRNIQSGSFTGGFPGPMTYVPPITDFKIVNGVQSNSPGNIMEVWNGAYSVMAPSNGGPAVVSFDSSLIFCIKNNNEVSIRSKLRIGPSAANGAYANYGLSVDGDIIAKRCVIQATSWADYVFAPGYQLPALSDVKSFIESNKHLPGVPSEAEVKANGVNLGEMDATLLKKVEELTLYIIELETRLKKLEGR